MLVSFVVTTKSYITGHLLYVVEEINQLDTLHSYRTLTSDSVTLFTLPDLLVKEKFSVVDKTFNKGKKEESR